MSIIKSRTKNKKENLTNLTEKKAEAEQSSSASKSLITF